MDGNLGLRAWRWLFLIEGVITVAVAFAAYFVLPDFPKTTKWLTEEETAIAAWRLEEDIGEDDWTNSEEQTLWHGFKLALVDVKMWVLVSFHSERFNRHRLTYAACAVVRQRLSSVGHQLLPHRRQHPRLFQCCYSSLDHASVRARRHHRLRQRLARRQDGGEVLAHHASTVARSHYVHHLSGYN